jgi:hypothetical protein
LKEENKPKSCAALENFFFLVPRILSHNFKGVLFQDVGGSISELGLLMIHSNFCSLVAVSREKTKKEEKRDICGKTRARKKAAVSRGQ